MTDAPRGRSGAAEGHSGSARGRFWVSVHFRCCRVYTRVYFRHGETEAQGRCPRCLRAVRFEIREDADDAGRFFTAGSGDVD